MMVHVGDFTAEDGGLTARCTNCCSPSTHPVRTDVYSRTRDGKSNCIAVTQDGSARNGEYALSARADGNPSDAVRVLLWCDDCGHLTALTVAQHNGKTQVRMTDLGEDHRALRGHVLPPIHRPPVEF